MSTGISENRICNWNMAIFAGRPFMCLRWVTNHWWEFDQILVRFQKLQSPIRGYEITVHSFSPWGYSTRYQLLSQDQWKHIETAVSSAFHSFFMAETTCLSKDNSLTDIKAYSRLSDYGSYTHWNSASFYLLYVSPSFPTETLRRPVHPTRCSILTRHPSNASSRLTSRYDRSAKESTPGQGQSLSPDHAYLLSPPLHKKNALKSGTSDVRKCSKAQWYGVVSWCLFTHV